MRREGSLLHTERKWLAVLLFASAAASAEDLYGGFRTPHSDWSAFAGGQWTDNATLVPGGSSDTVATGGLRGSLYDDSGNLKTDVDGVGYYEHYVHGTFDDHWLGTLRANVVYAFVPERLTWAIDDGFGQVNANPVYPTTPANRINANILSTGPDASIALGGDTVLRLGARYARSHYASSPDAPVDDERLTGNFGVVAHLSPTSSLSLNAEASRLEYRVTGRPGYEEGQIYFRYDSRNPRSGLAVEAGYSELRDTVTKSTTHSPVVRLLLFHRLSPSWNVNVSAGQQYQNASSALQTAVNAARVLNGQTVGGDLSGSPSVASGRVTADVALTQSPFRSTYGGLAFDFVRPRTLFGVEGRFEQQRYEFSGAGLDRDLTGVGAYFRRQMRRSTALLINANFERRKPTEGQSGDRTKFGDAGLEWRPGAMLAVDLLYHREERTADAGGFPYTVNRIYLALSYGPPKRGFSFQPTGGPATSPQPSGT